MEGGGRGVFNGGVKGFAEGGLQAEEGSPLINVLLFTLIIEC